MNTSTEAVSRLQEALGATRAAGQVIDDLIVAHDYQDIASLVVRAAEALLEAASQLMQSQDEAALEAIERLRMGKHAVAFVARNSIVSFTQSSCSVRMAILWCRACLRQAPGAPEEGTDFTSRS